MEDLKGSAETEENDLSENLEFWMTRLPARLQTVPINCLAIPGSHDTMTYTIAKYNEVGPDESMAIQFLGRYCSLISKPIIFNWSITQYDNVTQQLNGGIRYLDLRVATKLGSDGIYFLHGLYGSEISDPLQEVADWLATHPNEVVILDFQHFYIFSDAHHRFLIEKIHTLFWGKLCPVFGNFSHISLQWLALEKYQVFVIYRHVVAKDYTDLWPSGFWPTPWPDTVHADYLLNFLDTKLGCRSPQTAFVSQCLLTPDTFFVMKHVCGNLYRDLSETCRHAILPWIQKNSPGSEGLNIVIADFISNHNFEFPKTVIKRNSQILKDSQDPSYPRTYIQVQSREHSESKY
ncbi:PI-PLC X domain-containing protein 2 isoform X2 [Orussus abietinus]|uniref:PI-PLC X domain-containing protein 2 isoform X2 n=1 Tax=Orussus abietinus TaxID=222816 RepID=UPI000626E6AA|nr:PI-PLC X domain-containing protein 2 isoform X2 [Orussus abietinus]